jgi:hypothetical protein
VKYNLIHIVASDEFFAPLVQTQVFEQAYQQACITDVLPPHKVEVWIPLSARQFFSKRFRQYKGELQKRFVGIPIRFVPGIDRLKYFPRVFCLLVLRALKGKRPVVWHFRSEKHLVEFKTLKDFYRFDIFVADIRGIWPAERLLLQGIELWREKELLEHNEASLHIQFMAKQLEVADGITAVSANLLQWVQSMNYEWKVGWVVPCSSSVDAHLPDNYLEQKQLLRSEMGMGDHEVVLGYLGGTAPYQQLDEMVLPLMKKMLLRNKHYRVLLITHQPLPMKQKLAASGIDESRVSILSLNQQEVGKYLKVMDLGFLVRHENLVNNMAQPVKLGEYLAAGVPVCVEGNLGGMGVSVEENGAGVRVHISFLGLEAACDACENYLQRSGTEERAINSHRMAYNFFSWQKNIAIHRKHYAQLLQTKK